MNSRPRTSGPRPPINRRFRRPTYVPTRTGAPTRRVFKRRFDRPAFERRFPKAFDSFVTLGITAGLVVILGIALLIFEVAYGERVMPHVSVDGVALGSVSVADAERTLLRKEAERNGVPIVLHVGDAVYAVQRSQFGATYDYREALQQAVRAGHGGSFATKLWDQISTMINGTDYAIRGRHSEQAVYNYVAQIDNRITIQPKPAQIGIKGGEVRLLHDPVPGRRLDRAAAEQQLNAILSSHSQLQATLPVQITASPITHQIAQRTVDLAHQLLSQDIYFSAQSKIKAFVLTPQQLIKLLTFTDTYDGAQRAWVVQLGIDLRKLRATLAPIAAVVNKPPTPAYYRLVAGANGDTDYAVPEEGSPGTALDINATGSLILAAAQSHQVTVPLISPHATFNQGVARKQNFDTELAHVSVSLGGSDNAVTTNANAAAQAINEIQLQPGHTLSFTGIISPANGLKGFIPGLNAAAPTDITGVNGGAIRIASALFQAAYQAGLPVIARTPYPYLTQADGTVGYDAMVVAQQRGPDLQIVNDTKHAVLFLVQPGETQQNLKVGIFNSTDTALRSVQVSDPQVTINSDGSVDTLIGRTLTGGGKASTQDQFTSHYDQLDPYP